MLLGHLKRLVLDYVKNAFEKLKLHQLEMSRLVKILPSKGDCVIDDDSESKSVDPRSADKLDVVLSRSIVIFPV